MGKMCFVAHKYPSKIEPNANVFFQQLIWSLADRGVECRVIAPIAVDIRPQYISYPYKTIEVTENGSHIEVYWPKYFGLGDEHNVLGWRPAKFTTNTFSSSVKKTIEKNKLYDNDLFYGHFLEPAGICAIRMGKYYHKPSYVAFGEGEYNTIECYGEGKMRDEYRDLTGMIAVSTQNKEMLLKKNIVPEEKIGVFPNGYRQERFYPRNKIEARERFQLPHDKFIVCFVGSFDNRKGPQRVSAALDRLDGVYGIFAGKGGLKPQTTKALWVNPVENKDLPWFYSAADIFVLPTLHEGCCNAIVEALACGLPIVSSNRQFNDDILDESNSIRINPESIDELALAIKTLKNDPNRCSILSYGSLEKAKQLTLSSRAEKIYEFISQKQ